MKKIFKVILLSALVCCCLALVAGCAKSYKGEYHYNSYGTEYGVKVKVQVEDNVIKKVIILGSEYTDVSGAMGAYWSQEDVDNWDNNVKGLLKKYEGMTVDEVMALHAEINTTYGAMTSDKSELGGMLIDGATLGSARLLLAVQDALKG